jgi:prepilin-type N-terminal cleavage/methylation domain-containing protein
MLKSKHGFTLIELLIVIAVIGVLSSVIFASVNSARVRTADAAIKANLHEVKTQAELYYTDKGNSYTGICGTVPTLSGTKTIYDSLIGAQTAWGTTTQALNTSLVTAGSWDKVTCHENGAAYAAEVPLKASAVGSPVMWCLDSLGVTQQKISNLGVGDVTCN